MPNIRENLERHHDDAWGWALRCCRGVREDAEDVLHDAYLRILEGRARYRGRATFRTWLFGVIRLIASEHRRRNGRSEARSVEFPERVSQEPDPLERVEKGEETARLQAAMALLSAGQHDVLHLVFYQGLTLREAAEILGLAIGTVRTHYARGKARLRREMEPRGVR